MAKIEVNHKIIRDVATAITSYCTEQDAQMRAADSEVKSMLAASWTGTDAMEFGGKWEGIDADDSTTVRFRKSLEDFANALNACAVEYQTAQENAYNKAAWLPKILT